MAWKNHHNIPNDVHSITRNGQVSLNLSEKMLLSDKSYWNMLILEVNVSPF